MIAGAGLPVEVACRVLGVSGAGYYAWRSRPPSARTVRHAWLTDVIREVHAAAYGSYGARRVHAELVLGRGIRVGHNAVAMLMRRAGTRISSTRTSTRSGSLTPGRISAPRLLTCSTSATSRLRRHCGTLSVMRSLVRRSSRVPVLVASACSGRSRSWRSMLEEQSSISADLQRLDLLVGGRERIDPGADDGH